MVTSMKTTIVRAAFILPILFGIPQARAASEADRLYYSEPELQLGSAAMIVERPPLQALLTIERNLDPFNLDAGQSRQVGLKDVVEIALRNNLTIQISNEDVRQSRFKLLNSYAQFLPSSRLGINYNRAQGHVRLPVSFSNGAGQGAIPVDNPFIIAQAGIQWKAFQGGKVLFSALQNRNLLRSNRWQYKATTNDVLLESARRYYDLLLSEALLQIRIQAVKTSEEQVRLNQNLEADGLATHLDVLQAQTQLADDQRNLIEQQVARRQAAINLADYINVQQDIDLEPIASAVTPVRLIAEEVTPAKLLAAAIEMRPELKSLKEQVLAARKKVMVAASPLYPTVQLGATEYGIGETLSNAHRTVVTYSAGPGTTSALTPITLSTGSTTARITSQSRQITGLGVLSVNVNWQLQGFGLADYANIREARSQVHQAQLRANQEVNTVIAQVRKSYLEQLSALRRTELDNARIQSSAEELRLAQLRLQTGLGKNIDVLRAQQDLTNALVQRAQSAIEFSKAQVQLLHDIGIISRERLLAYTPTSL